MHWIAFDRRSTRRLCCRSSASAWLDARARRTIRHRLATLPKGSSRGWPAYRQAELAARPSFDRVTTPIIDVLNRGKRRDRRIVTTSKDTEIASRCGFRRHPLQRPFRRAADPQASARATCRRIAVCLWPDRRLSAMVSTPWRLNFYVALVDIVPEVSNEKVN